MNKTALALGGLLAATILPSAAAHQDTHRHPDYRSHSHDRHTPRRNQPVTDYFSLCARTLEGPYMRGDFSLSARNRIPQRAYRIIQREFANLAANAYVDDVRDRNLSLDMDMLKDAVRSETQTRVTANYSRQLFADPYCRVAIHYRR